MKGARSWQHNQLAADLAHSLQTPYVDVPLGSIWLGQLKVRRSQIDAMYAIASPEHVAGEVHTKGTQLADVVTVLPSYTRFCLSIYEVKISRADFQADIRKGKWQGYLDHCHRIYFATPAGLVTRDEIPPEAGWIVRGDKGWKVMKGAPSREFEIPHETMMSLIFSRQRVSARQRRLTALEQGIRRNRNEFSKHLGKDLAEAWVAREDFRKLVDLICGELEIEIPIDRWDVLRIARQIRTLRGHSEFMNRQEITRT